MTLVKWTPNREMLNYFNDVDTIINQAFSHSMETEHESRSFKPFMNVNESDLEYTVFMDLPGVDKKDVEVNMSEGIVTVNGKRKNIQHEKDNSCIWKETSYGTFRRSFELSNTVQEDKINARFKNGVLTLIIPKAKEIKTEIKRIAVR